MSLKNIALASIAAAALAACGGGGSGSSAAPEPTLLKVQGQAAKGVLSGALVIAETLQGTEWVRVAGMTPEAGATTDENGKFTLSYPEQNTPVRLRVVHQNGAKMFNEATNELEDMASDLSLSSLLTPNAPSAAIENNINAYTELAFVAANGDYSPASVDAANQVASAVAGKPAHQVTSEASKDKPGNAQDTAMKALLLNAGEGCDVTCAVTKLTAQAAGTLTKVEGKVVINTEKLSDFTQSLEALDVAPAELEDELKQIEVPVTTEGGEKFDKFVQNLRSAFLKAEGDLRQASSLLNQRYADFTQDSTISVAEGVADMLTQCGFFDGAANAECFDEDGWKPAGNNTYTKLYTTDSGIDVVVKGSATYLNGALTANYVAEKLFNGTVIEKANLQLSSAGVDLYAEDLNNLLGKEISLLLNGTVEQVTTPAKMGATLTLKDMKVSTAGAKLVQAKEDGNVHLDANNSTFTMAGDIQIKSSLGDFAQGVLSTTIINKETNDRSTTAPVVEKLQATLTANATGESTQTVQLNISGNFTPAATSSQGFSSLNLNSYAKINNSDVVKFDLSRTSADKVNASLRIGVGADAIVASVQANETKLVQGLAAPGYCFEAEQKFFCAADLNLSSSDGKITALVKADTLQGDLKYNGTKFGEISKSGVTVDGQKYSFY